MRHEVCYSDERGGEDGQTQYHIESQRRGPRAIACDGALAQHAALAGAPRADCIAVGRRQVQSRSRAALRCHRSRRQPLAPALSGARAGGLQDELRPGRLRSHDDERVAELIRLVSQRKPEHATHWSVRSAAQASGISKSTVGRYFALFGLQPHRSKNFKLSTDPFFVEKVRDVVGLYQSARQCTGAVRG